jgi:trehalose 6-phosphate phosphatase
VSLEEVRANLARAAILLDFDGTLAPIVADPAAARPVPDAEPVLRALCERAALVAVITGRPEGFVRSVLDVARLEVVGLYGLGDSPPMDRRIVEAVGELTATVPGAELEDKGVSVAVHVRRAADPDVAAAELRSPLQVIAEANGLSIFEGKRVIELAPAGARKAGVVRQLLARARPDAALYAGDDAEDAAAFTALADAGLPMCRVAVTASGTPERLIEVADVQVEGPEALVGLLRTL